MQHLLPLRSQQKHNHMLNKKYPAFVRIVEVSPRDGLQNINQPVSAEVKAELINQLSMSGINHIEVGSFVSPKWVPQMANTEELIHVLKQPDNSHYIVLTPNSKGLNRAIECGVRDVAVFAAASETFSQKNTNCSIEESLFRFKPVVQRALDAGIRVRGYVSCVLGCPYEGEVDNNKVAEVSQALIKMGCYEVSLGDTIGVGTPVKAQRMVEAVLKVIPAEKIALHFHDTRGQALANILACLEYGISTIDASVAGLGGCPYADGASGNLATEEVIYMLDGMGIKTGVNLNQLIKAGQFITQQLGIQNNSRVATSGSPSNP